MTKIKFLLSNRKSIKWCGKDIFCDRNLNFRFRLNGDDFYSIRQYYELKAKVSFSRVDGNVIAEIHDLKLQLPFPSGLMDLKEIFIDEHYKTFRIPGAVVLDIGASIGDSSIYFAWKGAKKVIAYEPIPEIYAFGERNIRLNNLQENIELRNEAISSEEGTISLSYNPKSPEITSSVLKAQGSSELTVKKVSINRVIQEIGHIDILKMDCEGEEWAILPSAIKEGTLDLIDGILIEVHVGVFNQRTIEQMEHLLTEANFNIILRESMTLNTWFIAANNKAPITELSK